ncbi:MAG: CAP domain-containing protein, partial [Candidatus Hydrothermarchaeales archaeon]
ELINEERIKNNLTGLTWDDGIANAARKHSGDMGTNNYFAHDSLDGRVLKDRLMEEEISCSPGCGENIIMHPEAHHIKIINGIEYPDYLSQDQLARDIVKSWMNSPGHRENILTDLFKTSGMGVYYVNSYYYVTQDFKG